MIFKKPAASGMALLALLLACDAARPQDKWPSRAVTAVVCCAGTVDAVARAVVDAAGQELGQPVVVLTKPGASGMIAADSVAKSRPDGYTILVSTNSSHGANQSLFKSVPYDYVKDFTPIGGIAEGKLVLVVNPSSPVRSVAELSARARAQPGGLTYGWASSSTRLAMEKYKMLAKVDIRDVPYKTNPQAAIDISGNTLDMMFGEFSSALPLIKAGRLRALAVSSLKRDESLPDVPTMAEAGVPGYQLTWWMAAWAPAGTPREVIDRVGAAIRKAQSQPGVQAIFATAGVSALPLDSAQLGRFQVEEHDSWRTVIRAAGIEPQ